MASPRQLRLRFDWRRTRIVVIWGTYLAWALLLAAPVHALDPNKRITQRTHSSWRVRDGSTPARISAITQTSNRDVCRFGGVRLEPWSEARTGAEARITLTAAIAYERWRNREVARDRQ